MRYTLLNKSRYIIKMLFIIFIQNLYNRFNKKKLIIFTSSKTYNFLFNYSKPYFKYLNSIVNVTSVLYSALLPTQPYYLLSPIESIGFSVI